MRVIGRRCGKERECKSGKVARQAPPCRPIVAGLGKPAQNGYLVTSRRLMSAFASSEGSMRGTSRFTLLLLVGLALGGCQASSAPDYDRRVDAPDAKLLVDYGGAYEDAKLAAWISSVGQSLARRCDRPDIPFRFTVLDSGLVNAFSTPG